MDPFPRQDHDLFDDDQDSDASSERDYIISRNTTSATLKKKKDKMDLQTMIDTLNKSYKLPSKRGSFPEQQQFWNNYKQPSSYQNLTNAFEHYKKQYKKGPPPKINDIISAG